MVSLKSLPSTKISFSSVDLQTTFLANGKWGSLQKWHKIFTPFCIYALFNVIFSSSPQKVEAFSSSPDLGWCGEENVVGVTACHFQPEISRGPACNTVFQKSATTMHARPEMRDERISHEERSYLSSGNPGPTSPQPTQQRIIHTRLAQKNHPAEHSPNC